jgi:uncharacterized membrane protein YecN with MAPEG domain
VLVPSRLPCPSWSRVSRTDRYLAVLARLTRHDGTWRMALRQSLQQARLVVEVAHPAVLLLWAGLAWAAALSAFAVEVYVESGAFCSGLVQGLADGQREGGVCAPHYSRRIVVVTLLGLMGLVLMGASCLAARRRPRASLQRDDRPRQPLTRAALTAGLLSPFAYVPLALFTYIFVTGQGGETSLGLPKGWQHVCHAVGVVLAALWLRRCGLSVRTVLAAVAVSLPLMYLTLVGLAPLTTPFQVDESAALSNNLGVWLLAGVLVGLSLMGVAALQRRGATAPPATLSVTVALASVFGTTVVLMPQLLPRWEDADGGGPYPRGGLEVEVWLPVMFLAAAVAIAVVAAGYASTHRLSKRKAGPRLVGQQSA